MNQKQYYEILNQSVKKNMKDIKIACILDEFSYECFKYECNLISLDPIQWKDQMVQQKPQLLLVESAWKGKNESWRGKIGGLGATKDQTLSKMISYCKQQAIPTVFWNKEDPVNFEHFIHAAKLFDYIFTTDENSIDKYKKIVKHNRIYTLPFAAQIKIHNPIRNEKKLGSVAFAGTWYEKKHPKRKIDMQNLLEPALRYGIHIYDRMYHFTRNNNYKFPDVYRKHIQGSLSYREMVKAYKKYDVFLNVNSVQESPTMFSRRVFELLACGTNVISGYSVGIEKMFPNIVKLSKSKEDTQKHLDHLIHNDHLRRRLRVLGIRKIMNEHTYKHRLEKILETVGISYLKQEELGVSIIVATNKQKFMNNVFKNYERQNYEKKELVIVLNNNQIDINIWKQEAKKYKNVIILQIDDKYTLGACLNFAVDHSKYEYCSKMDDDNYYAREYLGDIMNAFKYTDADVVGKCGYYVYYEGLNILASRFLEQEHKYVDFVSGSTITFKKALYDHIKFLESDSKGCDTKFLKECTKLGIKIYSIDAMNHVVFRRKDKTQHTWKISDEEHLKKCRIIAYTKDCRTHVTI